MNFVFTTTVLRMNIFFLEKFSFVHEMALNLDKFYCNLNKIKEKKNETKKWKTKTNCINFVFITLVKLYVYKL